MGWLGTSEAGLKRAHQGPFAGGPGAGPHSLPVPGSRDLAGARQGRPFLCGEAPLFEDRLAPAPRALRCRPLAGSFLPMTRSHSSHRFCVWRAARSYLQHRGKVFKDEKATPKVPYKYPSCSGGKLRHDLQPRSLANRTREGKAEFRAPAEGLMAAVCGRAGHLGHWALGETLKSLLSVASVPAERCSHAIGISLGYLWARGSQYLVGGPCPTHLRSPHSNWLHKAHPLNSIHVILLSEKIKKWM